MKKTFLMFPFLGLLAACCSDPKCAEMETAPTSDSVTVVLDEVYAGTLPAADCSGINYVLRLHAVETGKDTLFTLEATYLDAEGDGMHKTFVTTGKRTDTVAATGTALRLMPNNGEPPMHFMAVNDTTLRMVNDSLKEMGNGLNYDLIKVTAWEVTTPCAEACGSCEASCQH